MAEAPCLAADLHLRIRKVSSHGSTPKESAMKKIQFALSMMALTVALCFASQSALAQSASDSARNPTAQQQPVQPNDQPAAVRTASGKMFEGTIVKTGDKRVLTAPDSKTTRQLEAHQKP